MSRNPTHQRKSPGQIREYIRAIHEQDDEATADETRGIGRTEVAASERAGPTARNRGPIANLEGTDDPAVKYAEPAAEDSGGKTALGQIWDFIRGRWDWRALVIWLALGIGSYVVYTAERDIGKLLNATEQHTKQLDRIEERFDRLGEKNQDRDLRIQENRIRLEYLERQRREPARN